MEVLKVEGQLIELELVQELLALFWLPVPVQRGKIV